MKKLAAKPAEDVITTVKVYRRFARKVAQLAVLLDTNQPDVLARYERHLDDDLLKELARREAELRAGRPTTK